MAIARSFVIGTRGSALALAQARVVMSALSTLHPEQQFSLQIVHTQGDRAPDVPLSRFPQPGVFVRELEAALLSGQVDLAVHSLKDLPTVLPSGLELVAIPPREDPRDVLASPSHVPLDRLPPGAIVGTGSLRRSAQLRRVRPDLTFVPIRGNLDTRWRKACSGEVDALAVAAAGLHRLGWRHIITEYLSPEVCLPAVGQGALAVEARAGEERARLLALPLDHLSSRQAVLAERAFLRALGGGCRAPIAALGQVENGLLCLQGLVAASDGSSVFRSEVRGPGHEAEALGQRLAEDLLRMGAGQVLTTP